MVVTTSCKVADLLVKRIQTLGVTRQDLAQSIGVTESAICQWCGGTGLPSNKNGENLCATLSIDAVTYARAYRADKEKQAIIRENGKASEPWTGSELDDAVLEVLSTSRALIGLSPAKRTMVNNLLDCLESLTDEQANVITTLVVTMAQTGGTSNG